MDMETVNWKNSDIAVIAGSEKVITDVSSAMDLMMDVKYTAGTSLLAIDKETICDAFFILGTGLAGEILQKFINYHVKAAFYGDYSRYTSKPLKDFIYESNQGRNFFFVRTKEEALDALASAK